MLIRMTVIGTPIAAALATGAIAVGALAGAGAGAGSGASAATGTRAADVPVALVIDSSAARDGRELLDERLIGLDAEVRVPRNASEARTNVRYFDELGYKVIVAGSDATAAAEGTGEPAVYTSGLDEAVAATR